MKTLKTFIIIILITFSYSGFACCGAGQYRIFPLGESEGKIIVAEFKLTRFCKNGDGAGLTNEIHFKGVINLGFYTGDTIQFISNVDSINFKSCTCEIKSFPEKSTMAENLLPYYKMAMVEAKKMPDFKIAIPITYKFHDSNDTINQMWFENYEEPEFHFKNEIIELKPINWAACGFLTRIMELRTYKIGKSTYEVITLTCDFKHPMQESQITENRKKFKNINEGFTFCPTTFHGLNRDYLIKN